MGKYTMQYDTPKLHNKACYTIPKVSRIVHKDIRHWLQYKREESRCIELLVIDRNDKTFVMGWKSSMLDHVYQFSGEIDILIIHKEGGNDKTPPYAVAFLSVVFINAGKP